MSGKNSLNQGLSMSVLVHYPPKDYSDMHPYKKSTKDFDKYSSQVLDRNASRQTHYTSGNYDFSIIGKLPESISSIRETFSYNPPAYSRRFDLDEIEHMRAQKISKFNDPLRQTIDIRSLKRKNDYNLIRSVSGYLNGKEQLQSRSQNLISQNYTGRKGSKCELRKQQIKSYNHINKLYEQRPFSIQEQIRKISQKRASKRFESDHLTNTYVKSYSTINDHKSKDNFAKKNYVEYYTPKNQKAQYNHRYVQDSANGLSPQYHIKSKKETSFDVTPLSPRKVTEIKDVKNFNIGLENNVAKKTSSFRKLSIDDFYVGKTLGQGRFGTAYLAIHKVTGAIFAIKKVKKQIIKSNKLIDQFILEVKLQSYLTHPFILKIYGIFDDSTHIYLILEFLQQGTLFNYLKKYKKLTQQETAQKIRYLAESIKYLQDRGIAHRDIKPQNIIMTNQVCKLADFGWATFCDEERRKTYCGTCDYVAPQILQGHEYDETVDLWCIGVMTYELMTGKAPFYHMSMKQTKKKIINVAMSYPQDFSEEVKSFVSGLIQKDPGQRMSIEEVLVHGFIKNVRLSLE